MTYFSPDYVKRRATSGGIDTDAVLSLVRDKFRVPYIEPVMAEGEIVTTVEGDIVMNPVGTFPLIELP